MTLPREGEMLISLIPHLQVCPEFYLCARVCVCLFLCVCSQLDYNHISCIEDGAFRALRDLEVL